MTLMQRTVTLTLEWDDNPPANPRDRALLSNAPLHRNDPGDDAEEWEYAINGEYSGVRLDVVSVTSTPPVPKEPT